MRNTIIAIAVGLVAAVLIMTFSCTTSARRYTNDPDIILIVDSASPNEHFRLLCYQFSLGALGETRAFWAVIPYDSQNINLADFELPDGYCAVGWTVENELLVEKWQTYYYPSEVVKLENGQVFRGVRLKITGGSTCQWKGVVPHG